MTIVDLGDFVTRQEMDAPLKAVELSVVTQVAHLLEQMGLVKVTIRNEYVDIEPSPRLLEVMGNHGTNCGCYSNTGVNFDDQ